jgi:hypothetical protein
MLYVIDGGTDQGSVVHLRDVATLEEASLLCVLEATAGRPMFFNP